MRKIEQQMIAAVKNNINWSSANTTVHFNEETGESVVRLHGNKIAVVSDTDMTIFDGGYQSVTTKSRLNALCQEFCIAGEGVFQKDFAWYVRHCVGAINGQSVYKTEIQQWLCLMVKLKEWQVLLYFLHFPAPYPSFSSVMQLTSKRHSMVVEFRPHSILTDKFVYTLKFKDEVQSMRLFNKKEMVETVNSRLDIHGYTVTDFLTEPQQYMPASC